MSSRYLISRKRGQGSTTPVVLPPQVRVAIYTRISSDPDGTALGVARQQSDCEALCATRGYEVAGVYADNDLSAFSGVVRPQYQRMLADIDAGIISGIVTYDTDRLTRRPAEMEHLIDLADRRGVKLATCSGDLDLGTDTGKMMARIVGAVNRKSSEDTARRVSRKKLELATAGKWAGGGRRPYGYERDGLTVVPDEAKIIREMARRVVAGESLGSIARDLDQRAIRTVGGKPWRLTTLRQLLTGGRIVGRRRYHGDDVAKASWPAIIDPELSRQVCDVLTSRNPRQRSPRKYLLSGGLLVCGRCGKPMQGGAHNGQRRYACVRGVGAGDHCGGTFIMAGPLEAHVRDRVVSLMLNQTDHAEGGGGSEGRAEVERQLEADQRRLKEIFEAYAAGEIDKAIWDSTRAILGPKIESGLRALSAQTPESAALRQLIPAVPGGGHWASSAKAWNRLDVPRQAAICRLLLKSVTIGPGVSGSRYFDPRRVSFEYA
jgi:DNA invertase Pin-like site-specific DNA recombinase